MKTWSILSLAALALTLMILGAPKAFAAPGPLGPNEFRDCPECPRMVKLPAGTFRMGDASPAARPDEKPVHAVTLPAFAVGAFEVTRAEYAAFVAATGYAPAMGCQSDGAQTGRWGWYGTASWRDPGYAQTDLDPVVCITWNDAGAYAAWLSQRTGKSYRLLSEAEWEYAARAGATTQYWWGDKADDLCAYANGPDLAAKAKFPNWPTAACDDGHPIMAPVGSYKPNAFGLYDMAGNAWEWTNDCYSATYDAPPRPFVDGPCYGPVLRGGSWVYGLGDLRSSHRNALVADIRGADLGFRLARSL